MRAGFQAPPLYLLRVREESGFPPVRDPVENVSLFELAAWALQSRRLANAYVGSNLAQQAVRVGLGALGVAIRGEGAEDIEQADARLEVPRSLLLTACNLNSLLFQTSEPFRVGHKREVERGCSRRDDVSERCARRALEV